jgi:hypothetical protein
VAHLPLHGVVLCEACLTDSQDFSAYTGPCIPATAHASVICYQKVSSESQLGPREPLVEGQKNQCHVETCCCGGTRNVYRGRQRTFVPNGSEPSRDSGGALQQGEETSQAPVVSFDPSGFTHVLCSALLQRCRRGIAAQTTRAHPTVGEKQTQPDRALEKGDADAEFRGDVHVEAWLVWPGAGLVRTGGGRKKGLAEAKGSGWAACRPRRREPGNEIGMLGLL